VFDSVNAILERYESLPTSPNPLEVMGVELQEASHQHTLAWLLNPAGDHGLGDGFLRCFLGRTESQAALELAASPQDLVAQVGVEVPLERSRLDILVACGRVLLSIEVKVTARQHDIEWRGESLPQAAAYARQLTDPQLRQVALASIGATCTRAPAKIVGIVVDQRADSTRNEEAGEGSKADRGYVTVDWLSVDTDLAALLSSRRVPVESRVFLEAFRTTLLKTSGAASPPWPAIQRLRRFVEVPALRRRKPLQALLLAGEVRRQLEEN